MKDDITIPVDLSKGSLTLEEIGTLVVLMSLPKLDGDFGWETNKDFERVLKDLIKEGVVIPSVKDDSVEIDLTWI